MKISTNTKISKIIKHDPEAIEVIASINPHFKKLKNPILRKVLAPRVTIEDAARIGKCKVEDFFEALTKIGFEIELQQTEATNTQPIDNKSIMDVIKKGKIKSIDVRPVLEKGSDPFNYTMDELNTLPEGFVLEVINSFEPTPLIKILNKKGYANFIVNKGESVNTYFLMVGEETPERKNFSLVSTISLSELEVEKEKFKDRFKEIDVRDLEMPLPMVTILNELEDLPADQALYVHHKKVPQYLLPELEDRKVKIWIAEIEDGNVKLLIHR